MTKVQPVDVEKKTRMCCVRIGDLTFAIQSDEVHEVLGKTSLRAVPRAPQFVAGVQAYRGEILLTVDPVSYTHLDGGHNAFPILLERVAGTAKFDAVTAKLSNEFAAKVTSARGIQAGRREAEARRWWFLLPRHFRLDRE